jgi:hypothetical protein
MKGSMVAVVGLLMIALASWVGQAEAQHRGGKAAAPHAPKAAGPRPGAGKAHPAQPKVKAQPKSGGGMARAAQKKQKPQDSSKAKEQAKKELAHKKEAKKEPEHKKEAKKELAHKKEAKKEPEHKKELAHKNEAKKAGADHDPESISLLHAAYQKLHEADHDYGGHRVEAMRHTGAALGHLGSSDPGEARNGSGNMPQPRSDAILREARTKLETIRSRLAAGTAKSSNHGEARSAVDKAIREVDMALAVR